MQLKHKKRALKLPLEGGNYAVPPLTSQLPSGAESVAGQGRGGGGGGTRGMNRCG